MSQIRKAHSLEIIDRRLRNCEAAVGIDAMELIGLHDELSRVERKWIEKSATPRPAGPRTRPLSNAGDMNSRFERLTRLADAMLRKPGEENPERAMLRDVAGKLHARTPLTVDPAK